MIQNLEITKGEKRMADGKRRYKSDRKDYKISVKLSEKDMDILKAALWKQIETLFLIKKSLD